jgi:RecJ-like exonuclease
MRIRSKILPPQLDLFLESLPKCPDCSGTGKRLFTIHRGYSVNGDWMLMKASAIMMDKWDALDPKLKADIEAECAKARWVEGEREYTICVRCGGFGKLNPARERLLQANNEKARLAGF